MCSRGTCVRYQLNSGSGEEVAFRISYLEGCHFSALEGVRSEGRVLVGEPKPQAYTQFGCCHPGSTTANLANYLFSSLPHCRVVRVGWCCDTFQFRQLCSLFPKSNHKSRSGYDFSARSLVVVRIVLFFIFDVRLFLDRAPQVLRNDTGGRSTIKHFPRAFSISEFSTIIGARSFVVLRCVGFM